MRNRITWGNHVRPATHAQRCWFQPAWGEMKHEQWEEWEDERTVMAEGEEEEEESWKEGAEGNATWLVL